MIKAVKGMKDILPDEIDVWRRVEVAAREVFESYLYREIRTPVLEPTELFARSIGEATDIVEKEMYTFEDSHQAVSMRPENTAGVVRALIEAKLHEKRGAMRFYYIGPMFRRERPQKGRYRQFHQIGVEAFGDAGPYIDAEIVLMLGRFMTRLGVDAYEVRVNSVGCHECRPAYVEVLKASLAPVLDQLCDDCRRRRDRNALRVFDCKQEACQPTLATLPPITAHLCAGCDEHFKGFVAKLNEFGVPHQVYPRLVRGLDYYTRTAFEFASTSDSLGAQNALVGGGRYDGLVKDLDGPDLVGIGFAMGIERLIMALPEVTAGSRPKYYVAHMEPEGFRRAAALAERLRDRGLAVAVGNPLKQLKSQFKEADRMAATTVYVLGPDELRDGVVKVKDMVTGEQRLVPESEV
ncbi:MAG: histidine--tRNA ligase [Acidobacteriota bacterium]